MLLMDVNILVYAHREDTPDNARYHRWLEDVINSDASYGMSDLVLSGFLRIVTHPKIFRVPSPPDVAWSFVEEVRNRQNCQVLRPGNRHWGIFKRLCRESGVKGNLYPDAFFAALAIETGSIWITTDHDYKRFQGLTCRHPLND